MTRSSERSSETVVRLKPPIPLAWVALFLVACAPLFAQQTDRERTEALARRAADRLQALQQEADRLAAEERTMLGDLRKLEIDRELRAEELRQTGDKATLAARELATVNEQVQRLEREEAAVRPELNARIVELYKLGQGRYLRLLLSTSDARRIGQASRMVAALAKRDHDRVASTQTLLAQLKSSRTDLEARGKELAAVRAKVELAQTAAERAVAARNELIRRIDQERDLNAQLAGELQTAQQRLQLTLRDIGTRAAEPAVLPLRALRGDLEWPVAGAVRTPFGAAEAGRSTLKGIEIAAPEDAPVQAVHGGTVAFADTFVGFGKLVILDHGAQTLSLYGNLSDILVARGTEVQQGQRVGSVGVSPTGIPGLYFELRVDARPVDPLQWLRKR